MQESQWGFLIRSRSEVCRYNIWGVSNISNACAQTVVLTDSERQELTRMRLSSRVGPPYRHHKDYLLSRQKRIERSYRNGFYRGIHRAWLILAIINRSKHWLANHSTYIFVRISLRVRHSPVPIPVHLKDEEKKLLDRDEQIKVCEKVPPGVPSVWSSPMLAGHVEEEWEG